MAGTLPLLLLFVAAQLPRLMGHCLLRCPYDPHAYYVCGTDGETYKSECELKRKACEEAMKGNPIALAYPGPCRQHGHYPSPCPPCPYEPYRPVCGSDGKTYGSRCEVQRLVCIENRYVTVVKEGPCYGHGGSQGGGQVGITLPGGLEISFNRCKKNCHHHPDAEVCGSDGHTYKNKCELEKASCKQHHLYIAHNGPCNNYGGGDGGDYCNPYKKCHPFGPRVCASNGFHYRNRCELERVACVDPRIYEVPCHAPPIHPPPHVIPPPHVHPGGSHTHPVGSNTYPGSSHTHPVGSHTHPASSHTHPTSSHTQQGGSHPSTSQGSHGTGSLYEKPAKPHPSLPEKPHITLPGSPGGHYETPNKPHITLPGDASGGSYDKPAKPHVTLPGGKAGAPRDTLQEHQVRSTLGDEVEEVEERGRVETSDTSLEDAST